MNKLITIVLTLVIVPMMSLNAIAETGNTAAFTSADPPEGVDLAIISIDAEGGPFEVGDIIRITSKVENISTVPSKEYVLTFYASRNWVITEDDFVLGVKNRPDLEPGQSHFYYNDWEIPASLPDGKYYVGAIITVADDMNLENNWDYDNAQIVVGDPPPPFQINPGLNDAWYNPETDGQGFFITVFPDLGRVSAAWFTYDTVLPPDDATANLGDPGHRWLTALGPYENDQASLTIRITSGGLFDTPDSIAEVSRVTDGLMHLTFDDCNSGTVEYNIPSIGQSGIVPIQRVAGDNIVLCEAFDP
jgi:hypothetical protein